MEIDRINRAIEQIEGQLGSDIDLECISREAGYTLQDFRRIFQAFSGMTVNDYIRKRRMTLAGIDLKYNGMSITDVSLKYGYRSPTSFARAFRAFHGFNPKNACESDAFLGHFPCITFQIAAREVIEPIFSCTVSIGEKGYKALCYGEADMSAWSAVYKMRRFFRLENAYDDLLKHGFTHEVLPYNNYPPIRIAKGDAFMIEYFLKSDGSCERMVYLADGTVWNGMPSTHRVDLKGDMICR